MKTYKISYTITRIGFFHDTILHNIVYVKASSEKEAWEIENEQAHRLSNKNGLIFTFTSIEEVK